MSTESKVVTQVMRFLDDAGKEHFGQPGEDAKTADEISGGVFGPHKLTGSKLKVAKILAPLHPPAVIGIGLNYRPHAKESQMEIPKNPVVFMKTASSVCGFGDDILIPKVCQSKAQVDYEVELAVVIGKPCKDVSEEKALDYVLGFTCANDVSARSWQLEKDLCGGQWCRGKTFDTFCPLGPHITLTKAFGDPTNVRLTCTVNDKVLQDGTTRDMIFPVAKLVSFLSQDTTLAPGTVILTGTPEGVGFARKPPVWLSAGDVVTVEVAGVGKLTNPVKNA